jgi:hypothetical protein
MVLAKIFLGSIDFNQEEENWTFDKHAGARLATK